MLQLEITESVLIENPDSAARIFADCKKLGVGLKIDDYGTGYSTIDYLRRFPFDALKLERRFIQQLDSGQNREMVEGLIKLAARLNLDVVAEGIETTSQLNSLRALGCKWGQGYLFSRPISPENAESLLASSQRLFPVPLEEPAADLLCA